MSVLNKKLEYWEHRLLDLGKRNKMINYRETKRTTLKFEEPSFDELFERLALKEEALTFQRAVDRDTDIRVYSMLSLLEALSSPLPVSVGDIKAGASTSELQKTLKNMRSKARLALEEQGTNILYLSFGFIEWKDGKDTAARWIKSPLILVPAKLTVESLNAPYTVSRYEDDIIVNPTLDHYLNTEYGVDLPDFDADKDDINDYLKQIEEIADKHGWKVTREVSLGLLSFLKISMYNDLLKNEKRILSNPVIKAIAGEPDDINDIPDDIKDFDPDSTDARDCYQVMSADSSQQDAIAYSKRNISFVMQGPPGTGKSQTITNIIAEALADGKKVLFVSEKMAALQVVYKRLQEAHLADFCLPLHSYKANKRDILEQLGASLKLKQTLVNDTALADLDKLSHIRDELNAYADELHKAIPELNISCYDVFGELESLSDIPSVAFLLDDILHVSQFELQSFLDKLRKYSLSLSNIDYFIYGNPWDGLKIRTTGYEYSEHIGSELGSVIVFLRNCLSAFDSFKECECIGNTVCYNDIPAYLDSVRLISTFPDVPRNWLCDLDTVKATEYIHSAEAGYKKLICLRDDIAKVFNSGIYKLDANVWTERMYDAVSALNGSFLLSGIPRDRLMSEYSALKTAVGVLRHELNSVCEHYSAVNGLLGTNIAPQKSNMKFFTELHSLIKDNVPLPSYWFGNELPIKRSFVRQAKENAEVLIRSKNELLASFDEDILSFDFKPVLRRYRTDYTDVVKLLIPKYWQDKKAIMSLSKTAIRKLDDSFVVHILNTLRLYREKSDWFSANDAQLSLYLAGHDYRGAESDWDAILSALDSAQKIYVLMDSNIPQQLKGSLAADHSVLASELSNHTEAIKTSFEIIASVANDNSIALPSDIDGTGVTQLLSAVTECFSRLDSVDTQMNLVVPYMNTEKTDIDTVYHAVESLGEYDQTEAVTERISAELSDMLGGSFNREKTDWQSIAELLDRISDLKENRPSLIPLIGISTERKAELKALADELEKMYTENACSFKWLAEQFDSTCSLETMPLSALTDKLTGCCGNIAILESWIDYREAKDDCIAHGLEGFITAIEKKRLSTDIDKIFLKSFYMMWLDAVCESLVSVRRFRKRSHEADVEAFGKLDGKQLLIAQMRIREKLISALPNAHHLLRATDEVAILSRELEKRRNIMPLRKLFRQIPNLLMRLKPCLMMSPLSVAYFLEAEAYRFDLVIFDEASQIFPEDAIGAIFRGSQVIIAGDSMQLPPTDFFSATTNNSDGDYDFDDGDGYDDIISDSILEETASVLPNRTLLWHYRSKHESLISFSNREIYKNSLITFPSNISRASDMGVEYIYVENGCYEGGGANCNIMEAQKCVELVAEHIERHPDRSLGIIAFSEKQQAAIENAITEFRESMPRYEWFFDESKDEPFFVKNLENVQGDERDTIIFSICYARDSAGKMYMRFGPLGHNGGERRLNVAITRAKCNIKLVGSILPSDIDLTRTNSEGVRMLRSYIEFARKADKTFPPSFESTELEAVDRFCDSVAEFLTNSGYTVHRNVGCSDYTIDIAVENPDRADEYIAGIECDGLSYIKARTARDRDHLRGSVLQSMGWNMYRVWSTEWSKNPDAEKNALLAFLRSACGKNAKSAYTAEQENERNEKAILKEIAHEAVKKAAADSADQYDFKYYREAKWYDAPHSGSWDDLTRTCETLIYIVSVEQPIHLDILYKRMGQYYSTGKATDQVCRAVDAIIAQNLSEKVTVDSDGFVRLLPLEKPTVRIPKASDTPRSMEYIHTEEVAEAMLAIIRNSFGITEDDLASECARIFGFERKGPKIRQKTDSAIAYLIENGRIRIIDNKIQPQENEHEQ